MRRPQRWLLIGLGLVVLGVVPIVPNAARVVVAAAGIVMVAVAVYRINGGRAAASDYDKHDPRVGGTGAA